MFEQARIKLTILYLAIIMSVSLLFSMVIYRQVTQEFRTRLGVIENRFPLKDMGFTSPKAHDRMMVLHDDYIFVRGRVLLILAYANGAIFLISGIAGYYLAGKTLYPIELAMEEQKRFVTDASHELKTPLTALQTTLEVALRDKRLKLTEAKTILKDSLNESRKLSKLTNDLLALARLEQMPKTSREEINLKDIVQEKIKSLSPIYKPKKIIINKKLTSVNILAHKESIERLIMILLDNAIKYTPKGGKIKIKLTKTRSSAVISIIDNGIGISKSDQKRIFERFYKVDSARTKSSENGYGIGLSMAKKITDLHGGSISVKSKVDQGSTFIIKLPIS